MPSHLAASLSLRRSWAESGELERGVGLGERCVGRRGERGREVGESTYSVHVYLASLVGSDTSL